MEMMIGYIYKTTNMQTGKMYIGQHQENTFNPFYLGSGKIIKDAIEKYGRDAFGIELLYWANTKEILNNAEIHFIKVFDSTNREIGYNITNGGEGWRKGTRHTEETKVKMSKVQSGRIVSDETRKILSESHKGLPSPKKGIPISEEQRLKMSKSLKGKIAWNKGLIGFMKGRKCSDETRQKMSKSSMGKPETRNGVVLSEDTKRKIGLGNKGKIITKETLNKMSVARKGIPWTEARRMAQNAKNIIQFGNDSEKNQSNDSMSL